MKAPFLCIPFEFIFSIYEFNQLETEKFIESVEISNLDFIKDTGSAPAILSSLPVATPGIIPKKGYQTPHWLPIKFEAGIRLIAMRLSCDTKQQDAISKA